MKLFISLLVTVAGLLVLSGLADPPRASGIPRATNTPGPEPTATATFIPITAQPEPPIAYPPPDSGAVRTSKAGPGEPCGIDGGGSLWWVIRFGSDPPEYLPCPSQTTPAPTATLAPLPPRAILLPVYKGAP